MQILLESFPDLSDTQIAQFEKLYPLYLDWNDKVNVISRKDIGNLYKHHILHSLAITKFIKFKKGSHILDLGAGGGFPGIPLAIFFPEVRFTLADSIRKKMTVAQSIADEIGLKNVTTVHSRAEELGRKFDFVVCRAVAKLDKLVRWSNKVIRNKHINSLPNGLITLKGGSSIESEINSLPKGEYVQKVDISKYYDDPYFDEKVLIYVQY